MKKRDLMLIVSGIILIGVGMGILTLINSVQSDSVFYIFPFFFFISSRTGSIIMIALAVSFIVLIMALFLVPASGVTLSEIQVTTCEYCEKQFLDESQFCPQCGKRVKEGVNY